MVYAMVCIMDLPFSFILLALCDVFHNKKNNNTLCPSNSQSKHASFPLLFFICIYRERVMGRTHFNFLEVEEGEKVGGGGIQKLFELTLV